MSFFEPTRDITLINRRRLIGFLSMAVAGGIVSEEMGRQMQEQGAI